MKIIKESYKCDECSKVISGKVWIEERKSGILGGATYDKSRHFCSLECFKKKLESEKEEEIKKIVAEFKKNNK